MRSIYKIDIKESIRRQELIFQESWGDKLDRSAIYIFFGICVAFMVGVIYNTDYSNSNDKFFSLIILPPLIVLGLFIIYRKATEKDLLVLNTPFPKHKNLEFLKDFAKEKQFEIYLQTKDHLIFNEPYDFFDSFPKKSMVFMVKDKSILFTILKDQKFKFNLPTLSSHYFLKRELEKKLLTLENVGYSHSN